MKALLHAFTPLHAFTLSDALNNAAEAQALIEGSMKTLGLG
jgi:hypothetical protein